VRLYWPVEHAAAVVLVDPAIQKYPALQFPEQVDEFRPCIAP
jgi:hypothetical protein